mmetsp:Transcript_28080/g.70453  ORF Transcript_28080/g.70453 Transcript_28080/m.70453 type:complete len:241 (-) Transcript_28080:103-825(-)
MPRPRLLVVVLAVLVGCLQPLAKRDHLLPHDVRARGGALVEGGAHAVPPENGVLAEDVGLVQQIDDVRERGHLEELHVVGHELLDGLQQNELVGAGLAEREEDGRVRLERGEQRGALGRGLAGEVDGVDDAVPEAADGFRVGERAGGAAGAGGERGDLVREPLGEVRGGDVSVVDARGDAVDEMEHFLDLAALGVERDELCEVVGLEDSAELCLGGGAAGGEEPADDVGTCEGGAGCGGG